MENISVTLKPIYWHVIILALSRLVSNTDRQYGDLGQASVNGIRLAVKAQVEEPVDMIALLLEFKNDFEAGYIEDEWPDLKATYDKAIRAIDTARGYDHHTELREK